MSDIAQSILIIKRTGFPDHFTGEVGASQLSALTGFHVTNHFVV